VTALTLHQVDVPQADNLDTIRAVVEAVKKCGSDVLEISERTAVSGRHVRYRLQAARILGFLDDGRALTSRGRSLLDTRPGSEQEKKVFTGGLQASAIVRTLLPDLLSEKPFDVGSAASKIVASTGMALATAERRARVLRSWRRRLGP
jgi:hypothetical protein